MLKRIARLVAIFCVALTAIFFPSEAVSSSIPLRDSFETDSLSLSADSIPALILLTDSIAPDSTKTVMGGVIA